ncbi:hypothetical protein D3C86_894840 [compost metagenome]
MFEEHSSSFSSPYLFNGKELDRETNLSYYSARYYDAKTSLWLNIDPLAEKFAGRSPYEYCFNNPVRLTDPTGMGPEDPIYKNIYIVLDYDGKLSNDANRESVKFTRMGSSGWKGIYAKDIQHANEQVTKYLNGTKANNVLLESHGNTDRVVNKNKDLLRVDGYFFTDNNAGNKLTVNDLSQSIKGTNVKNQKDVDALTGIIKQINSGGNFYLQSCLTANDDNFFYNLSALTGNTVNLFGSAGETSTRLVFDKKRDTPGLANYTPANLFDRNTILPGGKGKLYPASCADTTPILLNGVKINKSGISPF